MRVDNNPPHRVYRDFWQWLLDGWHIWFVPLLFIGYGYYLASTTEV